MQSHVALLKLKCSLGFSDRCRCHQRKFLLFIYVQGNKTRIKIGSKEHKRSRFEQTKQNFSHC